MNKQAYKKFGFWIGLILFFLIILSPTPQSLSFEAWYVAAVALLMAAWWGSEAIPLPITALLPLALFPLLEIMDFKNAAISYANPNIFLFMGGFILALAIQSSGLHKRLALKVIGSISNSATSLIGSFMCIAFFISMWVMNTSTTLMLLPICLAISSNIKNTVPAISNTSFNNFEISLLLGIAYASSIGGMSSLVGTAPNIVFAGFMQENFSIEISFIAWMKVALPIGLIMLISTFLVLTKFMYPANFIFNEPTRKKINLTLNKLGPITRDEKKVLLIFIITALLWVTRVYLNEYNIFSGLTDAGIAIIAAISLFIIPSQNKKTELLVWDEAKKLPWGLLILFGGGLSLAKAINSSGLGQWLGEAFILAVNFKPWILILLIVTFIIFLTELTSNTATTSTFLPIATSIAIALSVSPSNIAIPLVLASSLAFMLPVATPPNAIVYGSGKLTIKNMIKAGFILNLIGILIITFTYTFIFNI
ncbi:DASS family sodium-coupled anion symporter [Methylophilaceae bacterium]|nr:DASS family sodium-coupled anion symporter [Methylophilaceae bacterium]|tara:strand:- start:23691 stop:25127 length:1437 start_codon:yes stop_codon:yes gene_type:complete